MRRLRPVLFVAALSFALATALTLISEPYPSTSATFTDQATGNATAKAATNFVPVACRTIGPTLASWNIIKGTAANDTITGTAGNDLIFGLAGNDTITGANQADCLVGGDGSDTLSGGNQGDVLLGGNGNDALNGGNQTDTCDGGADTDTAVSCEIILNVP